MSDKLGKLESQLSASPKEGESTFSSRLMLLMGQDSESKFAQKCKIPLSTMRKYLSGSMPGIDKAVQIAKENGVLIAWLVAGEGPMRQGGSKEAAGTHQVKMEEFALIPGYNVEVSAGAGAFPGKEESTRKLAFRHKWLKFRGLKPENLVLVFAKGDSMEPTISDNNTLMLDRSQRELSDGQIYVIRTDGHLIVKRIQKLWNKGILLISDNKEYREQEVEPNEADDLEVIGRVVWIGKDV